MTAKRPRDSARSRDPASVFNLAPPRPTVSALEEAFRLALLGIGWRVVTVEEWHDQSLKLRTQGQEIVVQYMPHPYDPTTKRLRLYRLDFAFPPLKVAAEVDGFRRLGGRGAGGHTTLKGFMSDRERDRLLTLAGWRVLRYGPSDVKTPEQARRSAQFFVEVIRQIKEGLI